MTATYGLWSFGLLFGSLAALVGLCLLLDTLKGTGWARRRRWF